MLIQIELPMSSKKPSNRFWRFIAELLVVFVGVVLALLADGIRQAASEKSEARDALTLLLVDLDEDIAEYERAAYTASEIERWTTWLLANWDESSVSNDSLQSALSYFTESMRTILVIDLNRATYTSLENANRIRLLRPAALRNDIVAYYQVVQSSVSKTAQEMDELWVRLSLEELPEHIEIPYVADAGIAGWSRDNPVRVRTSWEVIKSDAKLHSLLFHIRRNAEYYRRRTELSQQLSEELRASIHAQL